MKGGDKMLLNSIGVNTTGTTTSQLSFKAADKNKFTSMISGILKSKGSQETSASEQEKTSSLQGLADIVSEDQIDEEKLAESLTAIQQLLAANGEEGKDVSDSLETAYNLVVNQLMELLNGMDFTSVSDGMFANTDLPDMINSLKAIQLVAGQDSDFPYNKQLTDIMQSIQKLFTSLMQAADGQSQTASSAVAAAAILQKEAAEDMSGTQSNKAAVNEKDGQTTSLKTLIDSIVQKVETFAKKQENATVMPNKVLNPLLVGTLKKAEASATAVPQESAAESKETDSSSKTELKMPAIAGQFQSSTSYGKPGALTLIQPSGNPVSGDQLEEQLENILKSSSFTKLGNSQRLVLRLAPENLGSLRIEILQNDGNLVARIMTTTAQAKDALDANMNSLKHGLTSQNINVDKIEVSFVQTAQEKETKDQQSQQENKQQQPADKEGNKATEKEQDDTSFLEELLQAGS